MRATIFFCALLLTAATAASAQTYKCKRPDGKTSFQDHPCEEGSKGGPVVISDPSPSSGLPPAKGAPASALKHAGKVDPDKAMRDAMLKDRNHQLEAQNRAMRCNLARHDAQVLSRQRPVYSTDKDGNRKYVEDADRQAAIAAAERSVAENCR